MGYKYLSLFELHQCLSEQRSQEYSVLLTLGALSLDHMTLLAEWCGRPTCVL